MWKLHKSQNGKLLVFALCGRIEREQLGELQEVLESEADSQHVVLNLAALKLVDQDVVDYLACCERKGMLLDNCPAYIREWITRKNQRAEI